MYAQQFEDFFFDIFSSHLCETIENSDILILINYFFPETIQKLIEGILVKNLGVSSVKFRKIQEAIIMLSLQNSGIILDFGVSSISYVPFYHGFVLSKYVRSTTNSGLTMFKQLYKSMVKNNQNFEQLDQNTQWKYMNQILVEFIQIPSKMETEIMERNFETDIEKMRNKIEKFNVNTQSFIINYLENYRVGNILFKGNTNIALEFLEFLRNMPMSLCMLLIQNIIPAGGLCMLNKFFIRFREELEYFCELSPIYKNNFPSGFTQNFQFVNYQFGQNIMGWIGALVEIKGKAYDQKDFYTSKFESKLFKI